MIVWIAEREIDYEAGDILGCFFLPEGGKAACEVEHAKNPPADGSTLLWRHHTSAIPPNAWWDARGRGDITYSVGAVEVQP